ncbi:MAG: DNA-packaging protein [Acidaminococcales bacterium]|jgi:predicted DNA-binding protein (UPF0251 family)|nr:DNA-packaging protein [Acidaminococcales bacterium]
MAAKKCAYWLTAEGLALLRGWARDGLADKDIAGNMGISRSTLSEWKKHCSDISDALKQGKDVADRQIENALYQKAAGGDTAAMIFWLKNRKPDKWRDRAQHEITGKDGGPVSLETETTHIYLPQKGSFDECPR